jgi:hypothetical protein
MSKLMIFKSTIPEDQSKILADICITKPPLLVRGGTYVHNFSLPFLCSETLKELCVIYTQGPTQVLLSYDYKLIEDPETDISYLEFTLTPEETELFKDTLLDTYCQLKLVTFEGNIYFNEPQKIEVTSSLHLGRN